MGWKLEANRSSHLRIYRTELWPLSFGSLSDGFGSGKYLRVDRINNELKSRGFIC